MLWRSPIYETGLRTSSLCIEAGFKGPAAFTQELRFFTL